MDIYNKNKYVSMSVVMKALSHPARLFIAQKLSDGESCVYDLAKEMNLTHSTVSKHLTIMKNAKILADDKRGQQVYYNLRFPCILKLFDCIENLIKSDISETIESFK